MCPNAGEAIGGPARLPPSPTDSDTVSEQREDLSGRIDEVRGRHIHSVVRYFLSLRGKPTIPTSKPGFPQDGVNYALCLPVLYCSSKLTSPPQSPQTRLFGHLCYIDGLRTQRNHSS